MMRLAVAFLMDPGVAELLATGGAAKLRANRRIFSNLDKSYAAALAFIAGLATIEPKGGHHVVEMIRVLKVNKVRN